MKKQRKRRPAQKHPTSNAPQQSTNLDWEAIIIFGLGSGIFAGASILAGSTVLLGLLIGLLIGFTVLPYFDSKRWKSRPILCASLGGGIGYVASLERAATSESMLVFVIVGAVVGYFSTKWAPYVTLP
jgi:hypothetical protein